MLNVTFNTSESNGTHLLNFSVSVLSGSNLTQVVLFGVDASDNDGYPDGAPANFSVFQNPTPPAYGTNDVFKCSWVARDNAFSDGTLNGFKVIANPPLPSQVKWFAYVVQEGAQAPLAVTGWASGS